MFNFVTNFVVTLKDFLRDSWHEKRIKLVPLETSDRVTLLLATGNLFKRYVPFVVLEHQCGLTVQLTMSRFNGSVIINPKSLCCGANTSPDWGHGNTSVPEPLVLHCDKCHKTTPFEGKYSDTWVGARDGAEEVFSRWAYVMVGSLEEIIVINELVTAWERAVELMHEALLTLGDQYPHQTYSKKYP
jgi:hypothetical protein